MKLGVTVPNNWGVEDPQQVLEVGLRAEELGYDSVWVMDHLFNTGYVRERLEDRPFYHPLTILSHLSALTNRVALGTSVLVLPYHNPVELAKYAASLDQMSGGRVILGVGAGAMTEEFQALGISMGERGSLTNESIAIMKELWAQSNPSYHSRRWDFSELCFSPKPIQQPHIPLWIGGSSPGALRRAARVGDGWHPSELSPEEFSLGRQEIRDQAMEAGRDPDSLAWSVRVDVEVTTAPPSTRAPNRSRLAVDPQQIVAAVSAYQQAGAEHVVLALNSGDVPRLLNLMEDIAEKVLPRL